MHLIDEGMIDLDVPVKKYLSWFEMKDPAYTSLVTVRHLLNQKSGFERQIGYFDLKPNVVTDFEKALASYIRQTDVHVRPGTTFLYSNLNYILLGLIFQHVTGNNYDTYMSNYILPAIGMKNTFLTAADHRSQNFIRPYHYGPFFTPLKSSDYYYSDFIVPAGYVSSNATDVARYMQFMLNKTKTPEGDTLLSPEGYALLTGNHQTGYAMGWFRWEDDSLEVINHAGLNENFSSMFTFIPEADIGISILCNINSLEFCAKADQEIRSIILSKSYPPSGSMEKKMRWGAMFIPLFILVVLIFNFRRWSMNEFQFGFVPGIIPNVRLVIGVILSLFLLFAVTTTFQMPLTKAIRFQPDIGWGLLLIAILGIISSLARYFGTIEFSNEIP
jgi:CubicO group peptidase (beta-lactamase class C family)